MTLRLPVIDELRSRYAKIRGASTLKAAISQIDGGRWEVIVRYKGVPVRITEYDTWGQALGAAIDVTGKRP